MQYSNKNYNPEKHDRWRALTVKQPYANDLVTEAYKDENGIVYGKKTIVSIHASVKDATKALKPPNSSSMFQSTHL